MRSFTFQNLISSPDAKRIMDPSVNTPSTSMAKSRIFLARARKAFRDKFRQALPPTRSFSSNTPPAARVCPPQGNCPTRISERGAPHRPRDRQPTPCAGRRVMTEESGRDRRAGSSCNFRRRSPSVNTPVSRPRRSTKDAAPNRVRVMTANASSTRGFPAPGDCPLLCASSRPREGQLFAQGARRMQAGEIVPPKPAHFHGQESQGVAHGQHSGGRRGGRNIERAGFPRTAVLMTRFAARPRGDRGRPVMAIKNTPNAFNVPKIFFNSSVSPEYDSATTVSLANTIPTSPCMPSVGWTK
jgi:hypothetical protein